MHMRESPVKLIVNPKSVYPALSPNTMLPQSTLNTRTKRASEKGHEQSVVIGPNL